MDKRLVLAAAMALAMPSIPQAMLRAEPKPEAKPWRPTEPKPHQGAKEMARRRRQMERNRRG